jgi:hypothetical protein
VNVAYDTTERWLWFVRGDLCVMVNFASRVVTIAPPPGRWTLLLTSASESSTAATLSAFEARIYRRQQ